jgi:hypothetical protein
MCSLLSSPAPSTTVILYIGRFIQQGVSAGVLESDCYAIKWHHDFNLTSNPCADNFLSLVIEGGHRFLGKPVNEKRTFYAGSVAFNCIEIW